MSTTNKNSEFDTRVVIVGGGILGAAMAHAIGGPGCTLLERDRFGAGVTAHSCGILRVLHEDAGLSDLARAGVRAHAAFRAAEGDDLGFTRAGMLFVADAAERDVLAQACARWGSTEYPLELLDAAAAAERLPGLRLGEGEIAVFEPEAGYGDAARTVRALVAAAVRSGVQAHEGVAVERVVVEGGRVRGVMADGRFWPAGTVVLASGTWSHALLAPLGVEVGLFHKVIQTVDVDGGAHPAFYDAVHHTFGRPDGGGRSRVGVVLGDRPAAPGQLPLDEAASHRARTLVAQRFTALAERVPTGGVRVADSYVPGPLGLNGFVAAVPGLFLCVGWGGTGFKVAPALGQAAAALMLASARLPAVAGGAR